MSKHSVTKDPEQRVLSAMSSWKLIFSRRKRKKIIDNFVIDLNMYFVLGSQLNHTTPI